MRSIAAVKRSIIVSVYSSFIAFPVVLMLLTGCQSEPTSTPLTEFKAELKTTEPNKTIVAGDPASTQIAVKNTSSQAWPSKGTNPVRVSYHLLDSEKKLIPSEGVRTVLPNDVKPNETVRIEANFIAPRVPGNYVVRFTLVQELVSVFDSANPSSATDLPIKVIAKQ
jgi:uncharacterized protein YcfL